MKSGWCGAAGLVGVAGMTLGACAWAATPAVTPIPFKRDSGPVASQTSGAAIGVLVISLLVIAAVLLIRKRLNLGPVAGGGPRLLNVLETARLGPRALLSVVEFDGHRYLIAQGEHGISCVASAPVTATAAASASAALKEAP